MLVHYPGPLHENNNFQGFFILVQKSSDSQLNSHPGSKQSVNWTAILAATQSNQETGQPILAVTQSNQ